VQPFWPMYSQPPTNSVHGHRHLNRKLTKSEVAEKVPQHILHASVSVAAAAAAKLS